MRQDIRFAVRTGIRAPAFVALAVLTLGIGIGVATAAFSAANTILLRPLPVVGQERIVVLWAKQRDFAHVPVRWAEVDRYARESRAFDRVGGVDYNGAWPLAMFDRGEPVAVRASWVTGEFFGVVGAVPQIGRLIEPRDDRLNAAPVAVISDGLWRRRYGGDRAVLGRTLTYDGNLFTIVGVAPEGFDYPRTVELWAAVLPTFPAARNDTASGSLDVVARLRPDATMEQGRRELDAFLDRSYNKWRVSVGKFEATARTLPDVIVGDVRAAVITLSAAALLVLMVACLNVANLHLVRGVARVREVAIRASLGATRARLIRQLLVESTVLAVAGVVLGIGVAAVVVRLLAGFAPPEIPRLAEVAVDGASIVFGCMAASLTVLVAGIGPAIVVTRGDLGALMRRTVSRSATAGRTSLGIRRGVLVIQSALAVLVIATAGLLTRSLVNLGTVELGFQRDRIMIAQLTMPWSKFSGVNGIDRLSALLDELQANVRAIPGVSGVAVTASPPYSGTGGWDALPTVDGQTAAEAEARPWVNMEITTPTYFETLGVPLVRGRLFDETDRKGVARVVVVNEAMARAYWPQSDAIGKRLWLGAPTDTAAPRYTVIGIVADMRYRELATAMPGFYLPNRQYDRAAPTWFVIRSPLSPESLVPSLRAAFSKADADAALLSVRTMGDYLDGPLARPRFSAVLSTVFACVALLLVAIGIYGIVGEHVRQSRRELGIRLALGARPLDAARMVVLIALLPVSIGLALGMAGTLVASTVVRPLLYAVAPADPATMVGVALVVLIAAGVACAAPARSAARLALVDALRDD
jgi:predicted permease